MPALRTYTASRYGILARLERLELSARARGQSSDLAAARKWLGPLDGALGLRADHPDTCAERERRILELDQRINDGATTADDCRILASVPDGERLVRMLAGLYREY